MAELGFVIGGNGTPLVRITISETLVAGQFTFELEQIGSGFDGAWATGDLKGEIRGLFFDLDGNANGTTPTLSNLIVDEGRPASGTTSSAITTGGSGENDVTGFTKTNSDVNMNGAGLPQDGGYDVGVAIGTSGIGIKGDDVQGVIFTLSWPAGSEVTLDDLGNEDFGVRMMSIGTVNSSETFISSRDGSAKIVGTSDHVEATLSVGNVTVNENAGYAVFTVSLSNASSGDISFNLGLTNGTALLGIDYLSTLQVSTDGGGTWNNATSATILAGNTSLLVRAPIVDDAIFELTESFTLTATVTSGPATNASASGTGTITDNDPAPMLSIDDVTVSEAAGTITFTVTKSGATAVNATVDYAVTPGTAVLGGDYTAGLDGLSGSLTFLPGETSKTITLNVTNDAIFELTESFNVDLSAPTNATILDGHGVGTITDNDPAPTLSIDDVTVSEAAGTITFTVTKSGATAVNATVDYAVTPDSAVTPGDYTAGLSALTGTLTFLPGETTKTITLNVTNDAIFELTESFNVNLSNPTNATISDAQGIGTITDDEPAPTVSIADGTPDPQTEGAGATITFTVSLSGPADEDTVVTYSTVDGSAVAGADFTGVTNGTVTIPAGSTSANIVITVLNDAVFETPEAFSVVLSNAELADSSFGLAITDDTGIGNIVDDEPAPTVSIADGTPDPQTEGAGATITFTVSLSGPADEDTVVTYSTVDGSALAGSDFTGVTNGTVTIPAGSTSANIVITVLNDAIFETPEAFSMVLSNAELADSSFGLAITDDTGIGNIVDDDPAPTLSIDDVTVSEAAGTITFTVTKSGATAVNATVDYAVTPDSAVTPGDYAAGLSALSGTLTFLPGETTKTITLNVTNDAVFELTESFAVDLSNPGNAAITDGHGVGTITDNDPAPSLSINDVTVNEAAGTIAFTVTKSGATAVNATVDYAVSPGTAGTPGDYAAGLDGLSGTLTFLPGETSKTITLNVTNDLISEATESFTVNLSNPTNATILDGQGIGTIIDNDLAATNDKLVISTNTVATFSTTALLANDGGGGGQRLHITGVAGDPRVSYDAATQTIKFDYGTGTGAGANIASFTYTVSDGTTTSTGTVSVDVINANSNTVDLSTVNGGVYSAAGSYQASYLDFANGNDNGTGSSGLDILVGSNGGDNLTGSNGNDVLRGGAGDDTINGGGGTDLIDFSDAAGAAGINFTLVQGAGPNSFATPASTGLGTDQYSNMEGVIGTSNNDTLTGSGSDDIIRGGAGQDTISGGSGNDLIHGGAGTDAMNGGAGRDTFLYLHASDGNAAETITGFTLGAAGDVLDLHDLLVDFTGYDGTNAFSAGYLAFTTSLGNTAVLVDADGTAGGGAAVTLVTLTSVSLTSADTDNYVT